MRHSFPTLRRAAILVIAAFSVVSAVTLVWLSVTRETIGQLSNAHLLGMLALFLLPGATFAAWELDRRAASDAEPPEDEPPVRAQGGRYVHGGALLARDSGGRHDEPRHRRRAVTRVEAEAPAARQA